FQFASLLTFLQCPESCLLCRRKRCEIFLLQSLQFIEAFNARALFNCVFDCWLHHHRLKSLAGQQVAESIRIDRRRHKHDSVQASKEAALEAMLVHISRREISSAALQRSDEPLERCVKEDEVLEPDTLQ